MTSKIEVMLASPPDRDELVAQLFATNEGQWGEVFRDEDQYVVEIYGSASPWKFTLDELIQALEKARAGLDHRFSDR
jgi:hypothetical protein